MDRKPLPVGVDNGTLSLALRQERCQNILQYEITFFRKECMVR